MKRRFWIAAVVLAGAALGAPVAYLWWHVPLPRVPIPRVAVPVPSPDPEGIIIHHSDTPGWLGGRPVGAAKISEMHAKRGFAVHYHGKLYHIGYHYVIREDGTIESGRPEHCIGAHSRITEYNHYLGICLVGNFSNRRNPHHFRPSVPTGRQLRSLVWLCSTLAEKYHIPTSHILRHGDVRQTACPGEKFPYHWLLWQVARYRPVVHAHLQRLAQHQASDVRRQASGNGSSGRPLTSRFP